MRTIDNVAPSKIGVTARALMPGLSLVLRPPDPSDPDPSRLDTLMELAAQERVEVLDTLRAWQQKTNVTLALILALVPFWVAAPHRWLTVGGLVTLGVGFILSVWALRPVKTFFPQLLGFIDHAANYQGLSSQTFRKGFLLDTATGLRLAYVDLRKVTNASLGALACAVASVTLFAINTGISYAGG